MNIHALVRRGTAGIISNSEHHSVLASVTKMGADAGASELVGFLIGKYHEKLQKTDVPIPLVAGAALQLGSIILGARRLGFASRLAVAAMRTVGDAGTNTFFALDGVARGYASAGTPLFSSSGGKPSALPRGFTGADRLWGQPQGATNVGAIPQAGPGDWLEGSGLRHFAQR